MEVKPISKHLFLTRPTHGCYTTPDNTQNCFTCVQNVPFWKVSKNADCEPKFTFQGVVQHPKTRFLTSLAGCGVQHPDVLRYNNIIYIYIYIKERHTAGCSTPHPNTAKVK